MFHFLDERRETKVFNSKCRIQNAELFFSTTHYSLLTTHSIGICTNSTPTFERISKPSVLWYFSENTTRLIPA